MVGLLSMVSEPLDPLIWEKIYRVAFQVMVRRKVIVKEEITQRMEYISNWKHVQIRYVAENFKSMHCP